MQLFESKNQIDWVKQLNCLNRLGEYFMHASKTMLIRIVLLCCFSAKLCSNGSNGAVYLWPATWNPGLPDPKTQIMARPRCRGLHMHAP